MRRLQRQILPIFKRHNPLLWPLLVLYLFLLLTGRFELVVLQNIWRALRKVIITFFKVICLPFAALLRSLRVLRKPRLPARLLPTIRLPRLRLLRIKLPRIPVSLPSKLDLASFTLGLLTAFGLYTCLVLYRWLAALPDPTSLTKIPVPTTTKIYDRNNILLYEIYQDINRTPVSLAEVPETLKQATIAIEDKDFYSHPGISLRGIARAAYTILVKRKIQGGSTLTQQLVKTVFFSPEQTVQRKVKEIITALRVEAIYPKDKILETYLNQISYGGTAYGVAAAAEQYFGKNLGQLSLAEATFLAGLPAAPTTNSPFGPTPNAYKNRQKAVLRRMVEDGYISPEEADEASENQLNFIRPKIEIKAPHFSMYVREELERRYGREAVAKGGLRVTTSLDLELQEKIQQIVSEEIEKVQNLDVGNGAALVTVPSTGEILAMIGSQNYYDLENQGQVNVTTSLRQPGSAIKPVTYSTAFKKGFTPATVLLDVPTEFRVPGQPPYRPHNYDGKFHGAVQVRFALGNSFNIPAVRTLATVGVKDMMDTAYEMGIHSFTDPSRYGLSLTLGGGEVKMTEMAVAFSTLANLGRRQELISILEVKDNKEDLLYKFAPQPGPQVLRPEIAYLVSHILLDNNARTAAFGDNSYLKIPSHAVSVKTGTTDDVRDNWTIGYTPSFLAAVWVGNTNGTPMNRYLVSGVTGAAPIWNRIMREILKDKPDEWPIKPDGVIGLQVCSLSGTLPKDDCPTRYEYFIEGTTPGPELNDKVTKKSKLLVAKDTGKPVKPDDPEGTEVEEREVTLISDPLTENYCIDCGSYSSIIDVTKIPYSPTILSVEVAEASQSKPEDRPE